tara:strand:+ start:123 stop:467 length:345 start_codon:yes stop_codon:yes gene_type:complete
LAARGNSEATIAKTIGVSPKSLQRLRGRDELVHAAYASGRGVLEDDLVGQLLKLARKGNVAATIFGLKSMAGYSDNPRPKDDSSSKLRNKLRQSVAETASLQRISLVQKINQLG